MFMKTNKLKINIFILYFLSFSSAYSIEVPKLKNLLIYEEKSKIETIEFFNEKNELVNLSDFKSDIIIINFWATWCAPCREEMPSLNSLQKNNDQMSIKVLPINIGGESLELSKKFFDELNINKLSLFIGNGAEIAKKYKLRGIPTTLFIDKNGYEFARVIGSIDFNNEEFLKWLKNQN